MLADTLSAAGSGSGQASHVHVDDEVDEGDEARIAVGKAPVGGIAQLLVGRTVVVGGPGGAHDVHASWNRSPQRRLAS